MRAFISSVINNLRLKWFISFRTLGYTYDYVETLYQIYLNHHKVIHYRDGYPVYSLSTPPLFSKPMVNLIARGFFRSVQNKNLPNLLSFAVNDECNADCEFCSFYDGVDDKKRQVVTTLQAQKILKDAQTLGVSIINFVGGEPLLRSDLPEIIKSVDKQYSSTVLFTNGWLLEEKVQALKESGLDGVYVSLDAPGPEKHDDLRRKKGLFNRALGGIKAAKDLGMTVGISTVMTAEAFYEGQLVKMIELAKKLKVHELLVFDAVPTGRLAKNKELIDNNDWLEEMIQESVPYNQSDDYPGILIYAYATSFRSVGCNGGTSYCYISPYGDMMPCDFNHISFGNVLKEPFHLVWERLTTTKTFCTADWKGCKLKNSHAVLS